MRKVTYPALQETVYRQTLPNGLEIIVLPRPGFSKKLAYFVTDFGAIHREFTLNGEKITTPAGIAHYLEHKLFDMPGGRDVSAEFAALGASPNAFTSYDMTAYYFSGTENFEACLRLLLEFVSTPYFTEESVQKEQGIIGQEIGMYEDNPDSRNFENLVGGLYTTHPIREPILGTRESITRITPELLHTCHKAFYRPGNMLLCVMGDVDPEVVSAIAREQLPAEDTQQVTRQETWQEDPRAEKALTLEKMDVAQTMFQLGFKTEPAQNGQEAAMAEVIGELAAEALFGESSRLYLKLYEEGLIDSSFGGGFETVKGMAMLLASGDSDHPEEIREAILEEAKRILREGIPEADFLRMKRSAMGRRVRDLDSFNSTIFRVCAYHFTGFDYLTFPELYHQAEAKQVLEFLEQTVREERCSMSLMQPKQEKAEV